MSGALAYSVICTIRDPARAQAWLDWLRGRHIAAVLAGGAEQAVIVRRDPDPGAEEADGTVYEVRYRFPDRATFDSYLQNHAPRLRVEGLALFPPGDGFSYARTAGVILDVPRTP